MAHIKLTTARTSDTFGGTYECSGCGFEAPATVRASGRGAAHGHGEYSAREAVADAGDDAGDVASWTLAFVPCPKCGRVDPRSRSYRIQMIIMCLVVGALIAGAMFLLFRMQMRAHESKSGVSTIALVIGGLSTVGLYMLKRRPWARLHARVAIDVAHGRIVPREDY